MKDKAEKEKNSKINSNVNSSPKRNAPSSQLAHREVHNRDKSIFTGFTFCFPLTDR